jgi:streptomycin 6-kinase
MSAIQVPEGRAWWRSQPGGAAWLSELPNLVEGCVRDWALTLSAPFEPAAISWVAPARLPDGAAAVLQVNFPEAESEHEADALQWWDGDGAVRLLAQDRARRALLIARCEPGAQLRNLPDETAANHIAAGVLRRIWKPAPRDPGYRTLAEESRRWARVLPQRWERHRRPFPSGCWTKRSRCARSSPARSPSWWSATRTSTAATCCLTPTASGWRSIPSR